ncbi:ester cyclase [Neptunicella sp. SCSIO 80796]|uniref:ester cyclase n=1 Tax=Neptunicella plasticusilytica TaxID=3117012 RepID=UPI003A4E0319
MSIITQYEQNKAVVENWFRGFWGNSVDLSVVDRYLAEDAQLNYSGRESLRGHQQIRRFIQGFRRAYPDLVFWQVGELIAEGEYVIGRWDGMATHTGPAFDDSLVGVPYANSGMSIRFTGGSIRFHLVDGQIKEVRAQGQALIALQPDSVDWFKPSLHAY